MAEVGSPLVATAASSHRAQEGTPGERTDTRASSQRDGVVAVEDHPQSSPRPALAVSGLNDLKALLQLYGVKDPEKVDSS